MPILFAQSNLNNPTIVFHVAMFSPLSRSKHPGTGIQSINLNVYFFQGEPQQGRICIKVITTVDGRTNITPPGIH